LCGQDARDAGCIQDLALGVLLAGQQLIGGGAHAYPAFGDGRALGGRLATDINHAYLARLIEMAENGRCGGWTAHCLLLCYGNDSPIIYAIQVVSSAFLTFW